MGIKFKAIKGGLDNSGIGAGLRKVATGLIGNIPGIGPAAAGLLNALPHVPHGAEAQAALAASAQSKSTAGVAPNVAMKELIKESAEMIEADPTDSRFPISQPHTAPEVARLLTSEMDPTGKKTDSQTRKDVPGGVKPGKVTTKTVWESLMTNIALVVGMLIVIAVAMRIPQVRSIIMGTMSRAGGYVRRSYGNYRSRGRRRRR